MAKLGSTKAFTGLVALLALGCQVGNAQNTDADLRKQFLTFILSLTPSGVVPCTDTVAEQVRNLAEDCLQSLTLPLCSTDLFTVVEPEQALLGGRQCTENVDGVRIFGGAMDFPIDGTEDWQVAACVQRVLESPQCLQEFQDTFPGAQGLIYSVDTPAPTQAPIVPTQPPSSPPTLRPTGIPTTRPSFKPSTTAPSFIPSQRPSSGPTKSPVRMPPTSRPSLRPTAAATSIPSTGPSRRPAGGKGGSSKKSSATSSPTITAPPTLESEVDSSDGGVGSIVDQGDGSKSSSTGRTVGIYVGAAAGGLCLILLLLLFLLMKRRKVENEHVAEVQDLDPAEQPKVPLRTKDSLSPDPVPPPPGILHHNNGTRSAAPRAQTQNFHPLVDDDYSAPGTSIGDPELTLISSVDMGSMDGSESFVDQNRSISLTISKDMLGGTSEVPKNRNAVLSRLGASLTPVALHSSSSSSDDGDSPPEPSSRKKNGFYELRDDGEDDKELLREIPDIPEPFEHEAAHHEEFAPDTAWDPDDSNAEEGTDTDTQDMFKQDRKSPLNQDDSNGGSQLPVPPELKDSKKRKPRSSTPRNVLGGSGKTSPPLMTSSSYSSGDS